MPKRRARMQTDVLRTKVRFSKFADKKTSPLKKETQWFVGLEEKNVLRGVLSRLTKQHTYLSTSQQPPSPLRSSQTYFVLVRRKKTLPSAHTLSVATVQNGTASNSDETPGSRSQLRSCLVLQRIVKTTFASRGGEEKKIKKEEGKVLLALSTKCCFPVAAVVTIFPFSHSECGFRVPKGPFCDTYLRLLIDTLRWLQTAGPT